MLVCDANSFSGVYSLLVTHIYCACLALTSYFTVHCLISPQESDVLKILQQLSALDMTLEILQVSLIILSSALSLTYTTSLLFDNVT